MVVSGRWRVMPRGKGRAFHSAASLRADRLLSPVPVVAVRVVPNDRIGTAVIGKGGANDTAIAITIGHGRRVVGGGVTAAPAIRLAVSVIVGVGSP